MKNICDLSEGKTERLGKTQSEGRRTISWIWKAVPADDLESDDFMHEGMYICYAFSMLIQAQRGSY